MINCSKCYGNEIEELVWIDLLTTNVVSRQDEYYCKNCQARVDIVVTNDYEWIEDVEPLNENDENNQIIPNVDKPKFNLSIDD